MECDNCGQPAKTLTQVCIIEPDGSRTDVRICATCRRASLPEGWQMETVFDRVAAYLAQSHA